MNLQCRKHTILEWINCFLSIHVHKSLRECLATNYILMAFFTYKIIVSNNIYKHKYLRIIILKNYFFLLLFEAIVRTCCVLNIMKIAPDARWCNSSKCNIWYKTYSRCSRKSLINIFIQNVSCHWFWKSKGWNRYFARMFSKPIYALLGGVDVTFWFFR